MRGRAPSATRPEPGGRLLPPSPAYARSYLEALREGFRRGTLPPATPGRVAAIAVDFEGYLDELVDRSGSVRLADGRSMPKVPFSIRWLVDGGEFVGEISIRHELDEWLRLSGGHFGYGVRPSRWRRGYGTLLLRLGLEEARGLGLRRALVTAHEGNLASRKVIEANGGRLEDVVDDIFGGGPLCRYWIEL